MEGKIKYLDGETMSLDNLIYLLCWAKQNAEANKKNIEEVPVVISAGRYEYAIDQCSFGF